MSTHPTPWARRAARRAWVVALLAAGCALFARPSRAHARGCSETSYVVGYHHCSRFGGAWDATGAPRLALGLTLGVRTFSPPATRVDGAVRFGAADQPLALGADQFAPGRAALGAGGVRAMVFVWRWLYLVGDFEYGLGPSTFTGQWSADGSLALVGRRTQFVTAGLGAGLAVPLGDFVLRAEFVAGAQWTALVADVALGENVRRAELGPVVPRLEPRAAFGYWVNRNVTVGVMAGAGLYPHPELYATAFIEIHLRAFDGLFDP